MLLRYVSYHICKSAKNVAKAKPAMLPSQKIAAPDVIIIVAAETLVVIRFVLFVVVRDAPIPIRVNFNSWN